jgi:two-component system NtrC family response regulator
LRRERSFIVVDCAAIPETLVESSLFGHVKGSFTGAVGTREGLIKQADGGTLFLDEIGELPLSVQKIFLRVLQERRFRPVGGGQESGSDFRLISATNRDLSWMVEKGTFRKDLLFRLKTLTIDLPPLRERPEDIVAIAMYQTERLCRSYGTVSKGFSPEFLGLLTQHLWEGNVRELMNALESAVCEALHEPTLFPKHLPEQIRIKAAAASVLKDRLLPDPKTPLPPIPEFRRFLEDSRKSYLMDLMCRSRGDIRLACKASGLSRSTLYELLKRYGISNASV